MNEHILSNFVPEEALADELDVHVRTIARWRRERVGPPLALKGRQILYHRDDVSQWLRRGGVAARQKPQRGRNARTRTENGDPPCPQTENPRTAGELRGPKRSLQNSNGPAHNEIAPLSNRCRNRCAPPSTTPRGRWPSAATSRTLKSAAQQSRSPRQVFARQAKDRDADRGRDRDLGSGPNGAPANCSRT